MSGALCAGPLRPGGPRGAAGVAAARGRGGAGDRSARARLRAPALLMRRHVTESARALAVTGLVTE